ncbi:M23 family metallopeptidase [Geomonas sp. Red32]|uniref:M23 family metallopeptidase n=1 Tax=Geomonas sp. Red32 TaxID=2912856 RepID=UPI00202D0CFC|nr:M23 family metallopeptidase [Geomonas sp. Red32]MCM0080380.1 M23 family metallopeptidase [Geomonas sp. Red32]
MTGGKSLILLVGTYLSLAGCAPLPPLEKGELPWDRGGDFAKVSTGNRAMVRTGVAQFGDAPAAEKPVDAQALNLVPAEDKVPPAQISTPVPAPASAPAQDQAPAQASTPVLTSTPATVPDPVIAAPSAAVIPPNLMPATIPAEPKDGYDFALRDVEIKRPAFLLNETSTTSHDLTACNRGIAPVSLAMDVLPDKTENVELDKQMPLDVAVPPNTDQVIVRSSPKDKSGSSRFSYTYSWSIGLYTAEHRCHEGYRFPFGPKVRAYASVADKAHTSPYDLHAISFDLPAGTEILAARKGRVVGISQESIDLLHDDSTIGTYSHLGKLAKGVTLGKEVAAKALLGVVKPVAAGAGYLYFVVWRPEPRHSTSPGSGRHSATFERVSFPVEFCPESGPCSVISSDQAIPAPKKQKHKKRG